MPNQLPSAFAGSNATTQPPSLPSQNLNSSLGPATPSVSASTPPGQLNGSPRDHSFSPLAPSGPPLVSPAPNSNPTYSQPPVPTGMSNTQCNNSSTNLPALRPVFGVSLEDLLKRDGSAIPLVIYQCIQAVDLYGLEVEGIYRLSGSANHVSKLRSIFDNGK